MKRMMSNPYTTIAGFLVIIGAVLSVFFMGATWTEAGIGIGAGSTLLMVKDPKFLKKN